MAKEPKKPPPETDPIQSERFRALVRDLEADGELDPADERALENLITKATPPRRPPS